MLQRVLPTYPLEGIFNFTKKNHNRIILNILMMKKTILLISMMFMLFCLADCQKQEDAIASNNVLMSVTDEDSAILAFQWQVCELNNKYGFVTSQNANRGIGRIFKLIVSIVMSDAVGAGFGAEIGGQVGGTTGAIVGAAVGGVTASVLTACNQDKIPDVNLSRTTRSGLNPEPPFLEDLIFNLTNATKEDSIGYFHNAVIFQMSSVNTTLLTDTSTYLRTDLTDSIYSCHNALGFGLGQRYYSGVDCIAETEELIRDHIDYCIDHHSFTTCPNIDFWIGKEALFSLISTYAQNVCDENANNIYSYTSDYLDLIDRSELTSSEKDMLSKAILVGYASSKLWNSIISNIPN